jgi:A/G-specific adenine glycosylase
MNSSLFNSFLNGVLPWYRAHQRDLPWRQTQDPYPIWLSEIILQQTRVQQGLPYFHQFLSTFPTISDLANASEDEVFRLWQGLGYYSRARNLHKTAQIVRDEFQGSFPSTYKEIIALPGVGPYTAAAISSFAFEIPKAAVDGNVLRWTSRFWGYEDPIDLQKTRDFVQNELDRWIEKCSPNEFNQASMEFGAMVCSPVPKCEACPIQDACIAFRSNKAQSLPIKSKKTKVEEKQLYAFYFHDNKNHFALERRDSKGIWGNLYTFPMTLSDPPLKSEEITQWLADKGFPSRQAISLQKAYRTTHILTHRKLHVHIFSILLKNMPENSAIFERWISVEEAAKLGVPKVFENYLKTLFSQYADLI